MVICLEQGADLHIAQLMPLPLIVLCFSKIQIGFTFLVPAQKGPLNGCVCVCECVCVVHYASQLNTLQPRYNAHDGSQGKSVITKWA